MFEVGSRKACARGKRSLVKLTTMIMYIGFDTYVYPPKRTITTLSMQTLPQLNELIAEDAERRDDITRTPVVKGKHSLTQI